jgi:ribosomal protein S12 methylthiotransferase accessory factor
MGTLVHKLAPFVYWERTDDGVELRTPDFELILKPEVAATLERLEGSWLEGDELVIALAEYGATITVETETTVYLYRLDNYFRERGTPVSLLRKGSTESGLPLFKTGYKAIAIDDDTLDGFGQDVDPQLAKLKAVVELYERHSCSLDHNVDLIVKDCYPPVGDLVAYSPWQLEAKAFPFTDIPSGDIIVAHSEPGDSLQVPLELVCFSQAHASSGCGVASSNGVAAHSLLAEAKRLAVFEIIERDALMVHWFNGMAREEILPPVSMHERLQLLGSRGFSVTFINLTLDTVPVIVAIMQRDAESYPRLLLGLGAHADPLLAIDKALQEVEVNATYVDARVPTIEHQQDIATVMDHQYWYDQPRNHGAVWSLYSGSRRTYDEFAKSMENYSLLPAAFFVVLNRDGQSDTGIHVIRAIVPGFVPIGFGYMSEPLGMARLEELPRKLGLVSKPERRTRLGYQPQPFA